ncbi:unnamed protein product [Caenorhabditis nigoni]|uniref:C2 domain-containing protein n=1 Tax=Caenorhabditis nigoni TaxID=1611254 RepID=A0A2G5UH62_9PELO|nr:hypothetical protein B9Z55_010678 [Caenorhabditis nigoni]
MRSPPLLILLLVLLSARFSSANQFWLSVEVEQIDWTDGCLTTALCSHPRFQLIKDLLPVNEKVTMNWPIVEHFDKESHRPFVSYWPSGRTEDISMSAQVVGTDRTYGFPRICDQSPSVRIFPEEHKKIVAHLEKEKTTGKPPMDSLKIKVKGKCFNATMTVVKHTERCPWCPDPKEITIIGQEPGSEATGMRAGSAAWLFGSSSSLISDDRIVHIGVLVLAVVAVLASTAFAVILVMYLRNKRLVKETLKKPRFHPYISVKGHEIAEDNNRYDLPWEQQQRPLTYWMTSSNKSSESTMTSPLDSASSLHGSGSHQNPNMFNSQHHHQNPHPEMYHSTYTRDGYQTYRPPPPSVHPPIFPPQTQLFHPPTYSTQRHVTSPNSSRHDDSGLESV